MGSVFGVHDVDINIRIEPVAALNRKTLDEAMDPVARKRNWSARSGLYMLLAQSQLVLAVESIEERQYQRCKIQCAINSAVPACSHFRRL